MGRRCVLRAHRRRLPVVVAKVVVRCVLFVGRSEDVHSEAEAEREKGESEATEIPKIAIT